MYQDLAMYGGRKSMEKFMKVLKPACGTVVLVKSSADLENRGTEPYRNLLVHLPACSPVSECPRLQEYR
jgi:hypothetical protein